MKNKIGTWIKLKFLIFIQTNLNHFPEVTVAVLDFIIVKRKHYFKAEPNNLLSEKKNIIQQERNNIKENK